MGKKNTPDTSMPGGGILRLRPMGFYPKGITQLQN